MIDASSPPYNVRPERPDLDSTPGLQMALNASGLRAEPVFLRTGRYWFSGNLTFPENAYLVGDGRGPFDPMVSPIEKLQGPTLLPMCETGGAFITIAGSNGGIDDLIIAYPNQVKPNDPGVGTTGPKVYPPTIKALWPTKIRRCYIPNAYEAIHALRGRIYIEGCHLNGYKRAIVVDDALDVVRITDTIISVWMWGLQFPQALDFWCLNNGVGIAAGRADGLQISNVLIFGKHTGLLLEKSRFWPDEGASGQVSNLNLDTVRNGIIAQASEERVGVLFTNLLLGPYWDAPGHAIWLQRPSSPASKSPPRISVVGGSIRHKWAVKPNGEDYAFRVDAGELYRFGIIGDDKGPRL